MWMLVMFDLPVVTRAERKAATAFRHALLDLGFEMAQYSVYMRFCTGPEQTSALSRRIEAALPSDGKVNMLTITDKQYERIQTFFGSKKQKPLKNPEQFVLF